MILKHFPNLIIALSISIVSCTEVIDIDINSSKSEIVVEATIAVNEPAKVVLSQSIGLDEAVSFRAVENAEVKISGTGGNVEILTETSPGIYYSKNILGEKAKSYSLIIKSGEHHITASCNIPDQVYIDSFKVENSIYPGGGPAKFPGQEAPFYEVKVKYTDPIATKNYYRFILYINNIPQGNNHLFDDRLTNGNQQEAFMIIYNPTLKAGDKIKVEMLCIDKTVYEYFNSMGNSTMGPRNASSPANPYTNLSGTLLGYFSAHTVEQKVFIIE